MKLNCLVIDDEPAGRQTVEGFISEIPFLNLSGSVSNATKAVEALSGNDVQLIFLDVQMPRINGIDLLRSLTRPPMAIMITAHSEYALQGYELDVMDYLLKPISRDRFQKACNKAKEFWDLKNTSADSGRAAKHFFIKCNNQYERITFDELLFVEAANNYVALQTKDKKLTTYLTFKAVCDYLPADKFMKVHKSFMVSLDKIGSIDGEKVKMEGHEVPISRAMRTQVLDQVLSKNVIKR